jgi:lipopolysaccharide export LptBFGC system permease protein LptF
MSRQDSLPGRKVRILAEQVLDQETVERVMMPALADLQHECASNQATTGLPSVRSSALRIRAYWGVWKTLLTCLIGELLRDRQRHVRSMAGRTVFFLVALSSLYLFSGIGWFRSFGHAYGESAAISAAAYFIPSTLVTVLPMAFFLAVAMRPRTEQPFARLIPAAMLAWLVCTGVMLAGAMFVVPKSNHAYRMVVFRAMDPSRESMELRKGLTEMTWGELNAHIRSAPSSRQEELARAHRQQRVAWIASFVVLALVGLGLAGRWRSIAPTIGWPLLLLVAYANCFFLAGGLDGYGYPSVYGVWTVNLTFAVVGLRLMRSRSDWSSFA